MSFSIQHEFSNGSKSEFIGNDPANHKELHDIVVLASTGRWKLPCSIHLTLSTIYLRTITCNELLLSWTKTQNSQANAHTCTDAATYMIVTTITWPKNNQDGWFYHVHRDGWQFLLCFALPIAFDCTIGSSFRAVLSWRRRLWMGPTVATMDGNVVAPRRDLCGNGNLGRSTDPKKSRARDQSTCFYYEWVAPSWVAVRAVEIEIEIGMHVNNNISVGALEVPRPNAMPPW